MLCSIQSILRLYLTQKIRYWWLTSGGGSNTKQIALCGFIDIYVSTICIQYDDVQMCYWRHGRRKSPHNISAQLVVRTVSQPIYTKCKRDEWNHFIVSNQRQYAAIWTEKCQRGSGKNQHQVVATTCDQVDLLLVLSFYCYCLAFQSRFFRPFLSFDIFLRMHDAWHVSPYFFSSFCSPVNFQSHN